MRLSSDDRPGICGRRARLLRVNTYSFLTSNFMCWKPYCVDCNEDIAIYFIKCGEFGFTCYFFYLRRNIL